MLAANFEDLKRSHGNYVALATDADSKELLEILSNLSDTFNHVNMSIDRYTSSYKEKTAKRNTPFRMEKMLLPKFDGNSRHYPRFLKDFTELVLPNIDTRESAYTLRQCLTKEVNDKLGSCDDDCDNMLKRLDVIYGDPSKIMESIVSDVHKFKRLDSNDHLKIIEFINMLERAHQDLKALGLETEIANANTISTIENKLPKPIQMDLYREIYKENSLVDKKAKFPHLLKFLCTERDTLEYSTSELRKFARPQSFNVHATNTAVDNQCLIHFWSDNHQTSECRTYSTLSLDNKFKV